MNTIDNKSVQTKTFRWKRWQRWAVGTGCALAAYSAAGFWLVPYVIKNQLPKFAEKELARQASIADVRFNPFTLRLEADQIAFKEAPGADGKSGAPLLSIGALAVQLEWKSIVRRAWSLAEIRITAPQAQLTITPDGKFNLAEVLATWQRKHPEKSDGGMPRLVIAHFALEQGKVDWQDQKAGYADNFTPINFTLDNISTLPDANGSYSLSADAARGGKLHWRGTASLSPIRGEGELILNDASLPGLAAYLKAYTRAQVSSGKLSARLPYAFSYADGKLEATVKGAGLALRDLALVRDGKGEAFTSLDTLGIAGVNVDLARQNVTVDKINLYGGTVAVRRDSKGEIDVANLMLPGNPAPAASAASSPPSKPGKWKVDLHQLALANVDVSAIDETVSPALQLNAKQLQLQLQLGLQQGPAGMATVIDGASFSLADLAMQRGAQTPFKLAQLGFTEGKIDLAAHTVHLGAVTASGAQIDLARNRQGEFAIAQKLPVFASGKADSAKEAPSAPWSTRVDKVELSKFGARFDDAGTGIKGNLQGARLSLQNVSNDMQQALPFELGVGLREGGLLTANGKFVPGTGAVDAQLNLKQLTLAPVQPLLAQHVKLKLAGGSLSGSGRLTTGGGVPKAPKAPKVRYVGGVDIAGLVLNETDGKRFASWKSVRADKLTASVGPDFVDIPELRVVEPNAQLIIENDRSLNAQRLLVKAPEPAAPAPAPSATATPAADAAFPVRVRRVRLQNAKLDFADLSLRPQFAAKIYELNGVVTGLSTKRDARSQIELDGRIDEFGLARVRGQLNPFAPTDNTDLNVVFKNVDMVSASPYTMKFAGYKVAEGKISLDLQYKVRNRQLDGTNQIVLDKLTLGERIDSPDALKLPLELALAILKDSDGRIDLGLPVSGDMNDPQFSYGALIWKAVGNVLTKIVTAPFRALGNLLGISADKLESIDFDAGSAVLLPPEREKLKQVAQILAKREQLKLAVPGQYSDTDAAALRAQAVRRAVAAKAGIKLEAGEEPGPLNLGERKIRGALRDLYGERFGKAELDKQKKAAESAVPATAAAAAASASASAPAAAKIPVLQRLGKLIEGEPQVADTGAFYNGLREQLEARQHLPADALSKLGAQRSAAILAALQQDGTPAARVSAGAPEKTEAAPGKLVGLKLGLAAK
ncbi:DUF748 domain-containing protein [Janthinobacterium lividum]|uniref:DUF748 domain-containing protein n=1 Tax=Janthinobacterium lividum TaxID=29581 RepID=UPI000893C580|nr:DUF748 domain-containing protein [Janthinobacterium lividum]OEZ57355.1 AsmA family protein [Janthinobacterium lividum]WQE26201.1 DUF748 domain-containing protein [Janthinobacterium lividum]STQ97087.1 Uncharacterized protein involved in outer membrane biogenesis [Janthinobacterium lividum]